MGCCHSTTTSANSASQSNENQQKPLIKILLLGTSHSGKSTVIKQLQYISNVYKTNPEHNMQSKITECVVSDMKITCRQSLFLNYKYEKTSVEQRNERFRNEILKLQSPYTLTTSLALRIQALYKDSGIQETLKHAEHFQISDNAKYFFEKIEEIACDEYEPSFDDCTRIYQRTIGYWQHRFLKYIDDFGEYIFEISDIGGCRSERKKWLNSKLLLNPNINTIIYVVAISEYDMVLYEDNTTNRLVESINCFEQMIKVLINHYGKTDFLKNKSIVLLFNKYDIFTEKIESIPITVAFNNFPENMNPNASDDVLRFMGSQFVRVLERNGIHLHVPLRIIRTIAIDSESINNMFNKLIPNMINNDLNNKATLVKQNGNNFVAPLMLQKRVSLPINHHRPVESQSQPPLPLLCARTQSLPVYRNTKATIHKNLKLF